MITTPQGHGEPCYYCEDPCNGYAADPGRWPVGLSHPDDPGVLKWHHHQCVFERLHPAEESAALRAANALQCERCESAKNDPLGLYFCEEHGTNVKPPMSRVSEAAPLDVDGVPLAVGDTVEVVNTASAQKVGLRAKVHSVKDDGWIDMRWGDHPSGGASHWLVPGKYVRFIQGAQRPNEARGCGHSTCDPRYGCSRVEVAQFESGSPYWHALQRESKLRAALTKLNEIRNSIVGIQGFNFSEHAYPMVAALNEAGFAGLPYPEARDNVGTLLERATKAEARVAKLEAQCTESPLKALRAELEWREKPWCSSRAWEEAYREGLRTAIRIVEEQCAETVRKDP